MDPKPPTRILVVDDQSEIRRALETSLRRLGYEVSSAENGEEGLKLAVDLRPQVILSDIRMPRMDGHTLLRRLATHGLDAAVVVMSGDADMDDLVDVLRNGAVDYLKKPCSQSDLAAVVLRAVDIHQKRRSSQAGAAFQTPADPSDLARAVKPAGGFALPARYLFHGQIGEGAMGTVYKALDTVLDRPVALKVLHHTLSNSKTARSYFLREARAAAGLNDIHVVTVFDAGFEGDVLYLVMEYLEGEDLETVATRPPGMSEKTALRYAAQVADALATVHAANIIHRDVKPGNVMLLAGTERVKLMDFGIAHLVAPEGQQRKATNVVGTLDFMAPEQFLGKGLGPWTDIYALGGTLFELVTGQVPFPGNTSGAPSRDAAPDPRLVNPSVSAATAELILACMAKDPKERPQSAAALRDALEQLAARLPA